jgi:hypothetical protein
MIVERRNGHGRIRRLVRKTRKVLASWVFGKKPPTPPPPRGPGPFRNLGRVIAPGPLAMACSAFLRAAA